MVRRLLFTTLFVLILSAAAFGSTPPVEGESPAVPEWRVPATAPLSQPTPAPDLPKDGPAHEITRKAADFVQAVQEQANTTLNQVVDKAGQVMDKAGQAVEKAVESAAPTVQSATGQAKSAVAGWWTGLVALFLQGITTVKSWLLPLFAIGK